MSRIPQHWIDVKEKLPVEGTYVLCDWEPSAGQPRQVLYYCSRGWLLSSISDVPVGVPPQFWIRISFLEITQNRELVSLSKHPRPRVISEKRGS